MQWIRIKYILWLKLMRNSKYLRPYLSNIPASTWHRFVYGTSKVWVFLLLFFLIGRARSGIYSINSVRRESLVLTSDFITPFCPLEDISLYSIFYICYPILSFFKWVEFKILIILNPTNLYKNISILRITSEKIKQKHNSLIY